MTSRNDHASHRRSSSGRGALRALLLDQTLAEGLEDLEIDVLDEIVADGAVFEDLNRAGVGLFPTSGRVDGEQARSVRARRPSGSESRRSSNGSETESMLLMGFTLTDFCRPLAGRADGKNR